MGILEDSWRHLVYEIQRCHIHGSQLIGCKIAYVGADYWPSVGLAITITTYIHQSVNIERSFP